jgi:spermidine synthase
VQELVLTGGAARREWPRTGELRFFQNGRLAVRGWDERAYHEALVGPAMAAGRHSRVLILGGGDGLALREVLRHPDVREVTVVEIDPGVVRLAREDPGLRALNGGSLDDPRAGVETEDAFSWLRHRARAGADAEPYDVVLSGLPGPGSSPSAKLYSQEFYGLVARATAPDGRLAVHAGSPRSRPRDFWTVEATLRAAGLRTCPYAVDGAVARATSRPGGQWGFLLAQPGAGAAQQGAGRCSLASAPFEGTPFKGVLFKSARFQEAASRAERGRIEGLPPSTLTHPRYRAEK